MKKFFDIVKSFACILALSFFFSCASNQVVNNDLLGTWYCTFPNKQTMEISLSGDNYNIKIDGVDNNRGVFTLTKKYGQDYIVFNIKELINERNRWEKSRFFTSPHMDYSYKMENGNLRLFGGAYAGLYTKDAVAPQTAGGGYFVDISGNRGGPYSMDELKQFVTSGQVDRETLVWKEGMLQWQQAGLVPELSDLWKALPPPLPPR
jgi:hypothetical protein